MVTSSAAESFTARPRSLWRDAWSRLLKNKAAMFGGAVVLIIIVAGLAAPLIAPYDPLKQNLRASLQPPSPAHWFGTDVHGRDIFSRILYGAAISLRIGFLGALLGGAVSIGWMAVVNFMIGSDFKWVLLAMALVWTFSLGLFWFERRTRPVLTTKGPSANSSATWRASREVVATLPWGTGTLNLFNKSLAWYS